MKLYKIYNIVLYYNTSEEGVLGYMIKGEVIKSLGNKMYMSFEFDSNDNIKDLKKHAFKEINEYGKENLQFMINKISDILYCMSGLLFLEKFNLHCTKELFDLNNSFVQFIEKTSLKAISKNNQKKINTIIQYSKNIKLNNLNIEKYIFNILTSFEYIKYELHSVVEKFYKNDIYSNQIHKYLRNISNLNRKLMTYLENGQKYSSHYYNAEVNSFNSLNAKIEEFYESNKEYCFILFDKYKREITFPIDNIFFILADVKNDFEKQIKQPINIAIDMIHKWPGILMFNKNLNYVDFFTYEFKKSIMENILEFMGYININSNEKEFKDEYLWN